MSVSEAEYKYKIPLEEEDGVEKPAYSVGDGADVVSARYTQRQYIVTTTGAVPHLHSESVNVEVVELKPTEGDT